MKQSFIQGPQWVGLMAIIVACGGGNPSPISGPLQVKTGAILGGEDVEKEQYSNVVALTATDEGYFCSGTLIAPKVVLTAAHCLDAVPASEMQVYFGQGSTLTNFQGEIEVEKILVHGDYKLNTRLDSDVGLVFLKQEAPKNITPAIILSDYSTIQNIRDIKINDITLVGFGRTDADLAVESGGAKRVVNVPLLKVTRKEMMVGSKAPLKGACKGDSGGPAFVKLGTQEYLVGVTSRAAGQNLCEDGAAYYGLTPAYLCWIEKYAGVTVGAHNLGCSDSAHKKGKIDFIQACLSSTTTNVAQTAEALKRAVGAHTCQEAMTRLHLVKNLDLTNRDLRDLSLLSEFKQIESVVIEGNPLLELDSIIHHPGIKDVYVDGMDLPEGGILRLAMPGNKRIHFKESILMDMFLKEKTFYVDLFLRRGMGCNWQDENGRTIMHLALSRGDSDSFEKFIVNGGDVDIVDNTGSNLLFFAKKQEDFKKILKLSQDLPRLMRQKNNFGKTALFKAITYGDLELVRYMVENLGAEINPNPENPMLSPLYFSLYVGQAEIYKYIYEKLNGVSLIIGSSALEQLDPKVFRPFEEIE